MKYILILSFLFTVLNSFAQTKEELRLAEKKKISKAFLLNDQTGKVKDTNQIILFAVKVKVDNSEEQIVVKDIELSDSTYMNSFKSYDFLKTVNYNVLTDRRSKNLVFIFPISISIVNVKKEPDPYMPIIDFNKSILKYLFLRDYFNDPLEDYFFVPGYHSLFFQEEQW